MYVKRNSKGEIEQVSCEATADCNTFIETNSPELMAFIGKDEKRQRDVLRNSDLEFVRVLEDVIDLLMDKGIISFTELPEPAQRKLLERQSLRRRRSVDLLGDDDGDGLI